jgi:hypothetical protein
MEAMPKGLDLEKAEIALKRAADKAIHGTREERSGRFQTVRVRSFGLRMPKRSNLGQRKG